MATDRAQRRRQLSGTILRAGYGYTPEEVARVFNADPAEVRADPNALPAHVRKILLSAGLLVEQISFSPRKQQSLYAGRLSLYAALFDDVDVNWHQLQFSTEERERLVTLLEQQLGITEKIKTGDPESWKVFITQFNEDPSLRSQGGIPMNPLELEVTYRTALRMPRRLLSN